LQQLDGLPNVLVGAAGTALGLPALPTDLLPALGGNDKPGDNATTQASGEGRRLLGQALVQLLACHCGCLLLTVSGMQALMQMPLCRT